MNLLTRIKGVLQTMYGRFLKFYGRFELSSKRNMALRMGFNGIIF